MFARAILWKRSSRPPSDRMAKCIDNGNIAAARSNFPTMPEITEGQVIYGRAACGVALGSQWRALSDN